MSKATGSAQRLGYTPGQKREARFKELPAGVYKFTLADIGKAGLAGWRKGKGPKKFPNRMIRFQTVGAPDASGKESTIVDFVSASPAASFRVEDLAFASAYPEALDVEMPASPQESGAVRAYCEVIDALLEYIKENEVVLVGKVTHEEYKGQNRARISTWLDPEAEVEGDDAEEEEAAAEDDQSFFAEEEEEEEAAEEEEEVVEAVPVKAVAKTKKR